MGDRISRNRVLTPLRVCHYTGWRILAVLRVAVLSFIVSIALGLLAGAHVRHVWQHQAERELHLRADVSRNNLNESRASARPGNSDSAWLDFGVEVFNLLDWCLDQYLEYSGCKNPRSLESMNPYQLYCEAGMAKDYVRYRCDTINAAHCGDHTAAAKFARLALATRWHGSCHSPDTEEKFAASLISTGECANAIEVIQTIRSVESTEIEKDNPAAFVAYRKFLMGQAYIRMRNFKMAIKVLREAINKEKQQTVPDEHPCGTMMQQIELALFKARRLGGDTQLARIDLLQADHCGCGEMDSPDWWIDAAAYQKAGTLASSLVDKSTEYIIKQLGKPQIDEAVFYGEASSWSYEYDYGHAIILEVKNNRCVSGSVSDVIY
jgi:hypothetical protein